MSQEKEENFKKGPGVFLKVGLPAAIIAFLGIIISLIYRIISYSNLILKDLSNYLSKEKVSEVLLHERNTEITTGILSVGAGMLALFLALFIFSRFTEGLKEISQILKNAQKGDLNTKIKIRSGDEIGEISHSLNQLVDYLRESQDILKKRDKEIQDKSLELTEKIKELEGSSQETEEARLATLNILEDVEDARFQLKGEKERIEKIFLSLTDGLMVLENGEILLMNPVAEKMLGTEGENTLEKPLNDLSRFQNLKIVYQFLKQNTKRPISRQEIIFGKPELTLQITVIPIATNQDLIVFHDVTRDKLVERMKTEFVSLAAHQLRTPLSAIKWTIRMMLDGDIGKISKEQRDFLDKTYQSNERMIGLINDLLNVARIEEGKYLFKMSPIKIEDIVQDLVKSYKEESIRKKLILEFKKPKEKSPMINVDTEKITLAIENLINNAIRYSFPGGRVTVSLEYGKKEVEVRVKDSGAGIPKEQQERVFTKFFRGANVIRMETEGSGLGLFITKNVIEAHGGKIWFDSEEKKGTTFHVVLPVKS